jgi:hypothetical protein
MPIDRPSTRGYVLLPLAAPHHRRQGLVHERRSTQEGHAKRSPLPAAVDTTTRMTYRQSAAQHRELWRLLSHRYAHPPTPPYRGGQITAPCPGGSRAAPRTRRGSGRGVWICQRGVLPDRDVRDRAIGSHGPGGGSSGWLRLHAHRRLRVSCNGRNPFGLSW